MSEITLTRDYRSMIREAKQSNNIVRMAEISDLLLDELGQPDTVRDGQQAEAGKAIAELINTRGRGPEAKKL